MKLLILGGTRFLGRHLVQAARAQGHTVTLFNRGNNPVEEFHDIEQLRGDRDGNLTALEGRQWDAVIDPSGYVPRVVEDSARLLANSVEQYVFISSCSVYADFTKMGIDEQSPTIVLPDPTIEDFRSTPTAYGGLKFLSEQVVERHFPGRTMIIRAGLLVGPYDTTDRFTYWPHRIARGGETLAPIGPEFKTQFIDARDISEWIIRLIEKKQAGTYNALGPDKPFPIGELLQTAQTITQADVSLTWVSESFLKEQQVEEFSELPLWVTQEEIGFNAFQNARALQAGLTFRPLEETIMDTLAWSQTRPADYQFNAGLTPQREQELLRAWHQQNS